MLKVSLFASTLLTLALSAPALAQSDTCFMVTEDGRKIPLGKLCQGQPKTTPRTTTPVQPTRTTPAPKPKLLDSLELRDLKVFSRRPVMVLMGSVTNISRVPVRLEMIEFQFESTQNNYVLGSVVVHYGVTLHPVQTAKIEWDFLRESTKGRAYGDVRVKPMAAI